MMRPCLLLAATALLLQAQVPDFRNDIAPILETNCVGCHNAQRNYNLRLDTAALAAKSITPGQPDKSTLYTTIEAAPGRPKAMPPGGPQLPQAQRDKIRQWIAAGAPWPANLTLPRKPTTASAKLDEKSLVAQLHKRITANTAEKTPASMKPYKATIPNSTVAFEMLPIPAGEFQMGNAANPSESPVKTVAVAPFWMQKMEVTWDEYRLFMFSQMANETAGQDPAIDAVSRPTRPYVEMSFGMGINGYPAISMTHHAANKYAQWLSAKTGHFYRLPTEAEWEYACRAGSTSDAPPSPLTDYAWFADNSNGQYGLVGKKKPNAWGLHDMLGNVMEWTLDQYLPDYKQYTPWVKSTQPYPHATRGGSWNDDASQLRCAARVPSDATWKMQDPQLPKSIWYHTDAQWLGFRLVRPLTIPTPEDMLRYWNNGVEKE
jgi:formylglycine-generating enzyme required for sulfatase activity